MVSSILKNYYHIPLDDQFTFYYNNEKYYLTNKPFPSIYQKYLSLIQINPLQLIININHQPHTYGYQLFLLQNKTLDLKKVIDASLIIQDKKTVNEIKQEWIQTYQNNLIYCPHSSIQHQIIYYTLFTLCQLSIELLNYYFHSKTILNCSIQHYVVENNTHVLCAIENLKIDLFISDLLKMYFNDYITLEQFNTIIEYKKMNSHDITLILCKSLYPDELILAFQNETIINKKKRLNSYMTHLNHLINLLNKYIYIPSIYWIK